MNRPKFVVVIGAVVILAIVFGGIFLWLQARSARGLSIELKAPDQVLVGVPFDLSVNVSNNSSSVLKQARLSLELPEGVTLVGESDQKTIQYKDLGNLGGGSLTQEQFRLLVTSGENSVKQIKASVVYLPETLGARFEKDQTADIAVGGTGLNLDVVTPAQVFSGEDFETVINFKNVSDEDYRDLRLVINYPPSFNFLKSDLPPDIANREWDLGDLRKGSENKIKITGNLIGSDSAVFDLKIMLKAVFAGESYTVNSRTANISISPSPLSLSISLNENPEYIAESGDLLNYVLTYANKTDVGLRDAVIRAQLIGVMFDFSRLSTNANFRGTDQTLFWNVSNTPGLSVIPPGGSGSVNFQLRVRPDYPIRRLNDKNFTLKVSAEIESPTVPQFVAASKTVGIAKVETKVAGQTNINARAYFRDADSGILNSGPFPPKVNKPTNFTVHWRITNYSTDISNTEVRAFLGSNVRMTGVSKSNIGSAPTYNERTQEVIWQIGKIPATRGVISDPVEAVFQIEATPSQAGNYWPLIGETTLKATDDFTGQEVAAKDFPITTSLPDDSSVGSQQGIVMQ